MLILLGYIDIGNKIMALHIERSHFSLFDSSLSVRRQIPYTLEFHAFYKFYRYKAQKIEYVVHE